MKNVLLLIGFSVLIFSCGSESDKNTESAPVTKVHSVQKDSSTHPLKDSIAKPEEPEMVLMSIQGENQLFGYKDTMGNWILKPQYDRVGEFSLKLAPVLLKGEWKIINKEGKIIHHLKKVKPIVRHYELSGENYVVPISERILPVEFPDGKFGFLNLETGRISPKYKEVLPFTCGLAVARQGDKYGYINHNFNWVIPPNYDNAFMFSDNRGVVHDGEGFWIIDRNEKKYNKKRYLTAYRYKEGVTFVSYSDKYMDHFLIDTMGAIVNKGPYDNIYNLGFENGECEVMKGNKCIVIDKKGNKIRESKTGCVEGC